LNSHNVAAPASPTKQVLEECWMPLKIHMISEYGVPQFLKNDLRHKILNLTNLTFSLFVFSGSELLCWSQRLHAGPGCLASWDYQPRRNWRRLARFRINGEYIIGFHSSWIWDKHIFIDRFDWSTSIPV
jgi:hypothetical protein